MQSHSHIITPREVTGGFRGGSLTSRNILQLNGKLLNPQPTESCLCWCTHASFDLTPLTNPVAHCFSPLSFHRHLNTCTCVYSTPRSNERPLFGRWPCSCLDQLNQIHFTFCLLAAPLNHSIFSLIELAEASLVASHNPVCVLCVCVCVCVCSPSRGTHTLGKPILSSIREAVASQLVCISNFVLKMWIMT